MASGVKYTTITVLFGLAASGYTISNPHLDDILDDRQNDALPSVASPSNVIR